MSIFNFKSLVKKYSKYPLFFIKTTGFYDYENGGEYKETVESKEEFEGAVTPLSTQELKYDENGKYKSEDKKLYCYKSFDTGDKIEHKGLIYTIDKKKDYSDFDDSLNIYYMLRSDVLGTDTN
jgi:hypothetical protein